MANAESTRTALLFSFSAGLVLLLARRDAIAALVLAALDRFNLDGRGLLDLATKRNMILLCHAILLVILRDAGILGAPVRRRAATATTWSTSSSAVVAAAPAADDETLCSAPPLPRAMITTASVVVWRRPRSSAKNTHVDETGRRHLARRRHPRRSPHQSAATAAAAIPCSPPALTLHEPEQQQLPSLVLSNEIVLAEKATTTYLVNGYDLDEQASASETDDGKKSDSDRRIVVAEVNAAAAEEEAPELADDRMFDDFITKKWSEIRQENLQLLRSSSGFQQAISTY